MFTLDPTFGTLIDFYLSPAMRWIYVCIFIFFLLGVLVELWKSTKIHLLFEMLFEKVYEFYGDILWQEASKNIKMYVVTLFFVIFFSNIMSLLLSFIAPIVGISEDWSFLLEAIIIVPTADMQFNLALSLFSTILLLYVQFGSLGIRRFFYSYFPVYGKGYIEIQQWKLSKYTYYPLSIFAKIGDIIISLFLGFLDLVGLGAKIISLAFRLFWNITSGTILLGMLLLGMASLSQSITGFMWGINFPIIAPLIVYTQSLLVAVIQAMVFPLLVAIFIRIALTETA